jgi:SAM-dependent methyltransferase
MVAMQTPPSADRLRAIDEFLTEAWTDQAGHDDRLRDLAVQVRFDRGVAHLTGEVAEAAELRLVRDRVGRLAGVFGVWSRVRVGGRDPVVVDLGCGATKQYPGNLGLDLFPAPGVDAVADLSGSLPLADDSVDVLFAVHILEHLIDFLPLVDECHRVLRPGGVLHVMSPWWGHVNAVADPAHVRLLDVQTFKGICGQRPPGTPRWYPLHAGCDGASISPTSPPTPDAPPPPPGPLLPLTPTPPPASPRRLPARS